MTGDLNLVFPGVPLDRPNTDDVTWMLDLGDDPWPIRAYQIVAVEHGERGEVRVTACGRRATVYTNPKGWWSTKTGNFPLQMHAICCGDAQPVEGVKPR